MPSVVEPIAIPVDCMLQASARTANFADAYTVLVLHSSLSATQIYAAVVHVKNTLGRLCMVPVGPMHKIIAPAVLRRALHRL